MICASLLLPKGIQQVVGLLRYPEPCEKQERDGCFSCATLPSFFKKAVAKQPSLCSSPPLSPTSLEKEEERSDRKGMMVT